MEPEGPSARPEASTAGESAIEKRGIHVEGARLHVVSITEEDDEFTFILRTRLVEPSVPYELEVITGSSFQTPEPPVTTTEAASTLLFMTYPYIRELVANITGRSPYEPFTLPPLTKLPDPRVFDKQ